jgi:hypothetical protein
MFFARASVAPVLVSHLSVCLVECAQSCETHVRIMMSTAKHSVQTRLCVDVQSRGRQSEVVPIVLLCTYSDAWPANTLAFINQECDCGFSTSLGT